MCLNFGLFEIICFLNEAWNCVQILWNKLFVTTWYAWHQQWKKVYARCAWQRRWKVWAGVGVGGGGVPIRGGHHGEATVTEKKHCHLLGGACLCQTHSLHISHFSIKLCCMIYYVGCRNTFVWRNIWNVHRNAPMPNSFSCFKAALSRIWGL